MQQQRRQKLKKRRKEHEYIIIATLIPDQRTNVIYVCCSCSSPGCWSKHKWLKKDAYTKFGIWELYNNNNSNIQSRRWLRIMSFFMFFTVFLFIMIFSTKVLLTAKSICLQKLFSKCSFEWHAKAFFGNFNSIFTLDWLRR